MESSNIFPKGYYAACLIRFENSIPTELMNVRKTGEEFDKEKHVIYFLSLKEAYENIENSFLYKGIASE